jgi:hypothetical protein
MTPDEKSAHRSELLAAATALNLPINCRGLDEFPALDDGLLYAWSDTKQAVVCVSEDVNWGPELSSYVQPIDEYRAQPVLMIDVPNSLDGRIGELMDTLRAWFAD